MLAREVIPARELAQMLARLANSVTPDQESGYPGPLTAAQLRILDELAWDLLGTDIETLRAAFGDEAPMAR